MAFTLAKMMAGRGRTVADGFQVLHKGSFAVLAEEEPQQRLIFHREGLYQIWTPWTYYVVARVNPHIIGLFMSKYRIGPSWTQVLACAPLPNMYQWRPCYNYGPYLPSKKNPTLDRPGALEHELQLFWDGRFSGDGNYGEFPVWRALSKSSAFGLDFWDHLNVDQVLDLPWPPRRSRHRVFKVPYTDTVIGLRADLVRTMTDHPEIDFPRLLAQEGSHYVNY